MHELHQPDRRLGRNAQPGATSVPHSGWQTVDGCHVQFAADTSRGMRNPFAVQECRLRFGHAVSASGSRDHANDRWRPELDVNVHGGTCQSLDRQFFRRRSAWVGRRRKRRDTLFGPYASRALHRRRGTDLDRPAAKFRNRISEGRVGLEDPVSESAARLRLIGEPQRRSDPENDRWRADVEADRGE